MKYSDTKNCPHVNIKRAQNPDPMPEFIDLMPHSVGQDPSPTR